MLNHFNCVQPLLTLWTVALQAPLFIGFSRQILEWVAIPLSGDLSDPGIEPVSLMSPALAGVFFTTSATWEALFNIYLYLIIHLAAPGLSCTCSIFSYNMWNIVPKSGIKPGPPVLGARSLSHWTTLFQTFKNHRSHSLPKDDIKTRRGPDLTHSSSCQTLVYTRPYHTVLSLYVTILE